MDAAADPLRRSEHVVAGHRHRSIVDSRPWTNIPYGSPSTTTCVRSRLTVFFRLLLAIPHFIWVILWAALALLTAFANWFAVLITGRTRRPFHRFFSV